MSPPRTSPQETSPARPGLPSLIVTGASGFVGRRLLDAFKEDYRIFGLARRSQRRAGAPEHPNITWFQVDVGDRGALEGAFGQIRAAGGADTVVHLAVHYDFTGVEHPEYWRTNVEGLRNVLDLSRDLGARRFIFPSSTAACRLPPPGGHLDESSRPDGEHIYARTKGVGEAMLREYHGAFKPVIVRFAALFSDWCEYPPLFFFLTTWLSRAWNRRLLGGRGRSAIPYLHVREIPIFIERMLERWDSLGPSDVLIASPDGATTHHELFDTATSYWLGRRTQPILMPKPLCAPGMWMRERLGLLTGDPPFERPWMARYIDTAMNIDASRTRARLDWAPRERLAILKRVPFILENLRIDPLEWHRRNRAALKTVHVRANLRIHALLEKHEEEIFEALTRFIRGPAGRDRLPSYQRIADSDLTWSFRVALRQLMNAVRTRERGIFMSYCADLGTRRFRQGFRAEEVIEVLEALNHAALRALESDPEAKGLERAIPDHVTMTVRFGCDQVIEAFDRLLESTRRHERRPRGGTAPRGDPPGSMLSGGG